MSAICTWTCSSFYKFQDTCIGNQRVIKLHINILYHVSFVNENDGLENGGWYSWEKLNAWKWVMFSRANRTFVILLSVGNGGPVSEEVTAMYGEAA